MKKKVEKLARLQVLMSVKEKEELKKVAFKKRVTMSKLLMDTYRGNNNKDSVK